MLIVRELAQFHLHFWEQKVWWSHSVKSTWGMNKIHFLSLGFLAFRPSRATTPLKKWPSFTLLRTTLKLTLMIPLRSLVKNMKLKKNIFLGFCPQEGPKRGGQTGCQLHFWEQSWNWYQYIPSYRLSKTCNLRKDRPLHFGLRRAQMVQGGSKLDFIYTFENDTEIGTGESP